MYRAKIYPPTQLVEGLSEFEGGFILLGFKSSIQKPLDPCDVRECLFGHRDGIFPFAQFDNMTFILVFEEDVHMYIYPWCDVHTAMVLFTWLELGLSCRLVHNGSGLKSPFDCPRFWK